jgi:dipeptidyl aminopeptidase/acylaminoacyl peptidase
MFPTFNNREKGTGLEGVAGTGQRPGPQAYLTGTRSFRQILNEHNDTCRVNGKAGKRKKGEKGAGAFILISMKLRFAMFLLAAGLSAAATLEQYLSAPFASELTSGPGGGKIAWILNERGARNIWVAAAPDYKGRRLTAYKDDDGQDIGEIAWTMDGRSLIYTRGGDLDTHRDVPNPEGLALWPEQAIYIVAFDGAAPKKLTEGNSPAVSSDGRVAFLKNGQIWMTTLEGEKPVEVVHTKNRSEDLRWSPDGRALAFVSNRAGHAFIGVYNVAEKSLRYLDPSTDIDSNPAWSADGRRIAFIREASIARAGGAIPAREALTPWSIRVADASTGVGREIWRADKGPGSEFHEMAAGNQILRAAGDRLVFPWEKDGWQHLYSVPAEGGPAALLTPGEFEVEHVTMARNGRDLFYSSNQGDIDRRHVWRVSTRGDQLPSPLLGAPAGGGIELDPVEAGENAIAYLRAGPRETGRAAIKIGSAAPRDLAPDSIPPDYPQNEEVIPRQVIFPASDGVSIHGQLFLPPNAGSGKHAALVFFHGGSRRQMLLGWHYMNYYSNAYGMNQYLAGKGYVVLSVNYRSGIGYGLNFREAINYGAAGASEYNDVMGAGLYMASRPDVDPKRLGVWGGSYGGYLTALALARASDLFAAGVDFHGVEDWSARGGSVANPALDPDKQRDLLKLAFESSPMSSVKTWRSPVLLIHGDDDRNVDFSQTVRLVEALRAQGTEFEELIFPDEVHSFLMQRSWLKAYHAAEDFFARKLSK